MSDYDIGERIHEGSRSLVYRGRRRSDGLPVVLKQLRERYPSPAQLAAFAREFDVTAAAAGDGVIGLHELHPTAGLVIEDLGARSLAAVLRDRRFSVAEVLRVAIQVADALARVHRLNIVHRDINPSNVVIVERTTSVRLIDFGISQVLTRETTRPSRARRGTCPPSRPGA